MGEIMKECIEPYKDGKGLNSFLEPGVDLKAYC